MDSQHCTNADRHNKRKCVHFWLVWMFFIGKLLHKIVSKSMKNVIWQFNLQLLSVYVHLFSVYRCSPAKVKITFCIWVDTTFDEKPVVFCKYMDILYFYCVCHSTKWNKNFKYKTILIIISHAVTPAASRGRCCCNKPRALHLTWWCEFIFLILTPERGSEWISAAQNMRTCPDSGASRYIRK